jgi:hypothetical protein
MKKIILIISILISFNIQANQNLTGWKCVKDDNNFIMLYPFENRWAIITNKLIKAAKRSTGVENQTSIKITTSVVKTAPEGSLRRLWTVAALENDRIGFIEPICYIL